MSLIPQLHRGALSSIARLLDNYDNYLSNLNPGSDLPICAPSFDICETEDAYYFYGELPGVQSKNLYVELRDQHTLILKGQSERQSSSDVKGGVWCVLERSVGDFGRIFSFPTSVDVDGAHAHLRDGIISLIVPKGASISINKKVTIESWIGDFP
ncbi:HSP20-like chaperone [Penicillium cosmopolitanum]|uniref:HSP20-like chaperone n=1 Tax=Penicillium cosmopolitanum TaxID=1131564 RepID=A0A9W9W0S3_9EURO|nr:HSP20-like chaperone [Penicillium cosmopolitanum]KAJ5394723.1 HSP20-like chaperone [Penicillium cosmopolitanum]